MSIILFVVYMCVKKLVFESAYRNSFLRKSVTRSITPQSRQRYKRVLDWRMAVSRLSAGCGFACTRGYTM